MDISCKRDDRSPKHIAFNNLSEEREFFTAEFVVNMTFFCYGGRHRFYFSRWKKRCICVML